MEDPENEFYNFMMPPSIWSKKPHASRFKMTIADAAVRHPNATPILSTREGRRPTTAITADAPYQRGTRALTPQDEAYQAWLTSRIGAKSGDD